MVNLTKIDTEGRNPESKNLDLKSVSEILEIINHEDQMIAQAINQKKEVIGQAVELILKQVEKKGRVFYLGAGTSGRLGVLDASEMLPTYNDQEVFHGIIAGGDDALKKAIEGAEDSHELAEEDLKNVGLTKEDVVFVIGASGRTPYCLAALEYSKKVGASSIALAMTKNSQFAQQADITIEILVGPEVVTGSTRMKAGTATKMVLNMISTTVMVKLGKVYDNLMVDVVATNEKLKSRTIQIIKEITDFDEKTIVQKLKECDGDLKATIVALTLKIDYQDAQKLLTEKNLRQIIG